MLNEQRKEQRAKKLANKSSRIKKCDRDPGLNCFKLNKGTWKTNPKWDGMHYCTN